MHICLFLKSIELEMNMPVIPSCGLSSASDKAFTYTTHPNLEQIAVFYALCSVSFQNGTQISLCIVLCLFKQGLKSHLFPHKLILGMFFVIVFCLFLCHLTVHLEMIC